MSSSLSGSKTRAAILLAAVLGLVLTGCSSSGSPSSPLTVTKTASDGSTTSGTASAGSSPSSSAPAKVVKYVHIMLTNSDGATYGVGMPIIAYFNHKPATAKAFQDATKVTVDGKPATAAWYFEQSSAHQGYPYEAHLRLQNYWPAHSKIHVAFPPKGTSLGGAYALDGKLQTLDFTTGARNIAIVNNATHHLVLTSDGKVKFNFPVSLGASDTATFTGTKVVMEQDATVCMHDTNNTYYECGIKWDQRLTYSGEYLHAAPWNTYNIDHGINSSNGCTNLHPEDAKALFDFMHVGDVVQYPNADGSAMTLGAGYGDWNVAWSQWLTGGAVPTT